MEEKNIQNEIVEAAATKAADLNKEAITEKANELKTEINSKTEQLAAETIKLAKSIDEVKEIATKSFNIGASKRSGMAEFIKAATAGIADVKKKGYGNVELNLKDFVASDGDDNYQIYQETRVDDIKYDPNHVNRLRNFIPTGSTNGGAVRYNIEDDTTLDTETDATKAKGAASDQSSVTLKNVHEPVQTIRNVLTLPNEWLDDTAMIESYLSARMIGFLLDVEDEQILTGSGSGNNYNGINTQGTTYTQSTFETLYGDLADSFAAAADVNKFDALVATKAGMMDNNFRPSLVILNPIDVASILLIKSDQNEYVLQQTVTPDGSIERFWNGMRVIEHPAQTSGTFTMIDTSTLMYWMRGGVSFSFGYNDDDFASNAITARSIQRGAVTVYRPNGCANGTFDNAELALVNNS